MNEQPALTPPATVGRWWVHDLSPFLVRFSDNFGIRYYGLAYLLAFVIAIFLLWYYHRRGRSPLGPERQSEAIFAIVLGVMIGGRLGYVVLYGLGEFIANPLMIFKVWEGGMSSHGGFAGCALAIVWIARKAQMPLLRLSDILITLAPQGLLLGRLANFINGELWGKIAYVPWAVVFPQSAPGLPFSQIPPRHPSQLYEAALEGLLLLIYTQLRFWRGSVLRRPGQLTGEFLVLYAAVRILVEQFREPDASLIAGLSRGSFYSLFVLAGGIYLIGRARLKEPPANDAEPVAAASARRDATGQVPNMPDGKGSKIARKRPRH